MTYTPHTAADIKAMMEEVGVSNWEELFSFIPEKLLLNRPLQLPEALSEYDLLNYFKSLSDRCAVFSGGSFLGAGAYRHFIPSIVNHIISRSEYLTAYTPYQAEASQGTLQTIFEFQSLICRLTGMEVANASVYDGGTAAADAVLMAAAQTRRSKILISRGVHPQIREVIKTYLAGSHIQLEEVPLHAETGRTELGEIGHDTAAVLIQNPNFLGIIEDGEALCSQAHASGALAIVEVSDPVCLALLRSPGSCGADICCGDAQALGNPVAYGGPYVGFLACTNKLMRRIPGRLVGLTEDAEGRRGFCLTLQAREQHIRREKASSNICSNQALCALATTIYLSLLGPTGLKRAAVSSVQNTAYLKGKLAELDGFTLPLSGPSYNEFVLRCPKGEAAAILQYLACEGIQGGYLLEKDYPELADSMLLCCTELTKAEQIDEFANALRSYKEA
ncbi:MAG: aminomethyl-transferring glycine dehydrogenase subunit GcvPA [Candidatus Bruticola sp.]